ncbi:DUF4129 domain-containing protein [Virgibacillus siamensis]|uniref:DUF4129 domain-containing protein n=1 Tax=Virgibacillus siamensis TaxID=480071 RepID=UPI0009841397|nr:DUF4129 domain-containing protein [Virgibacillus siamensis]
MNTTKRLLDFLYECFFLFTVMEILYIIAHGLVPILPIVLVIMLNGVFFLFFHNKKAIPLPILLMLILGSLLLGFFTGLNIYASLIWTSMVSWRSYVHFVKVDIERENQHVLFIVSLVLCLIVYFPLTDVAYNEILLMLPFIQFIFLILLKVLGMVQTQIYSNSRKYMIWAAGTVVSAVLISFLGIYLFPVFNRILVAIITGIGAAAGLLIYPVKWLLQLLIGDDAIELKKDDEKEKEAEKKELLEKMNEQGDTVSFLNYELIVLAVVVIILIVIGIYFYKRKISIDVDDADSNPIKRQASHTKVNRRFQRIRPPKDAIRKKLYQLQKTLAKKGFPRYEYESVEEWFRRLNFNVPDMQAVITGYQKVRYGNLELSQRERERFEKGIKQLMDEAKLNKT